MKQMKTRHSNNIASATTGIARRALLLVSFLLLGLGSTWGQVVKGKTITIYQKAGEKSDVEANFYEDVMAAFSELRLELTQENCFTRWDVVKNGNYVQLDLWNANPVKIDHGNMQWAFQQENNIQYGYTKDNNIPLNENLNAIVKFSDINLQLGCKIECYVTNVNSRTNADPTDGYIVKVELILNETGSDPFLGNLIGEAINGEPQLVNRSESSVKIDLADTYDKLGAFSELKYARFYLIDNAGNMVNPNGLLTIDGATPCEVPEQGFYIYKGGNPLAEEDLSVVLNASKRYKFYKVVGVFSTDISKVEFENGKVTREPDWNLQYTYSFTYNPETKEYPLTVDWKRNGMTPLASTTDPDTDWDTSWEELALEHYVKWYVVKKDDGDSPLPLAKYNGSRMNETWTIAADDYEMSGNVAVLTGQNEFTADLWDVWKRPSIYAPAEMNYEEGYQIVCEIYANNTGEGNPNARYIFEIQKSFLGELKEDDDNHKGTELVYLTEGGQDPQEISLSGITWNGTANYARIWLMKTDGTPEDPDGKLAVSGDGVNKYTDTENTYAIYGYYLSNSNGINLDNIEVELNLGDAYDQYQVHVALSTGEYSSASEPDYDYVYTFNFTYSAPAQEIYQLLDEAEVEGNKATLPNKIQEIVDLLNNGVHVDNIYNFCGQIAQKWYAHWYITDKKGNKQPIQSGTNSEDDIWTLSNANTEDWRENNDVVWSDYTVSGNASQQWWPQDNFVAGKANIYAPSGEPLSKYAGYKIIFEVTDENLNPNWGQNPPNPIPEAKVRCIFEIPITFPDELRNGGPKEETQKVSSRQQDSYKITWEKTKVDMPSPKYARFYLTDYEGNVVNPGGKLEVTYNNGTNSVYTCKNANHGFYIYDGDKTLEWENIQVLLKTREAYKLYKVVGVFASNTNDKILAENGSDQALAHEPGWDLQYIYSFTYTPETKEYAGEIEWRGNGMTPTASVNDPNNADEWNISWKELSLGYCVKWYVVKDDEQQSLVLGTARQTNNWVINLPTPFTIQDNKEAVLKGQTMFTSDQWNTWGKPTVYAPSNTEYENGYEIVCEIYSNNDGTGDPNAKYIFSLYKGFLGEMKEGVVTDNNPDNEVKVLEDRAATTVELALSDVFGRYEGQSPVKYARVWLTRNGVMVDPYGLLSVNGMTPYTNTAMTSSAYGYYLTGEDIAEQLKGISAILELNAGSFNQYQIHVALSTDALAIPLESGVYEPNYDYTYTLGFDYPVKIKYKNIFLNQSNSCTPNLLEYWEEVATDCNVDRETLQSKLYVRWYLIDDKGMSLSNDFTLTNNSYSPIGNGDGYYSLGYFTFPDSYRKKDYNPTITLPSGSDHKNIRLVCVATTKTDDYSANPWAEDPELQVKYIYTLYKESDVEDMPFVHYQGEAYRYLKEDLGDEAKAKDRDYIIADGDAPEDNYTWDISTNTYVKTTENIRQGVHTYTYDVYVGNDDVELQLPFQGYISGDRSDAEPAAYIRWYDYRTDQINDELLEKIGNKLKPIQDWGWFFLNIGETNKTDASSECVGVRFKSNKLKEGETATIACDVSKYFDGIIGETNNNYLLHEPTLSIRYIFNIRRAEECADKIQQSAENFEQTLIDIKSGKTNYSDVRRKMFKLFEDNGRVVVSLNGNDGDFSVRTSLSDFSYYQLNNSNGVASMCTGMDWEVYYEDEKGLWERNGTIGLSNSDVNKKNVFDASFGDLTSGEFKLLSKPTTAPKTIKTANGTRFHLIGYLKNANVRVAAIHYELNFIDVPAVSVEDLRNASDGDDLIKRTKDYLDKTLTPAASVNFDDKFVKEDGSINYDKPKTWEENILQVPLEWDEAEYSFCYPTIEAYRQENGWTGFTPLHGDYILAKSMNLMGVSENVHNLHRWYYGDSPTLRDYTYIYKHKDQNNDEDDGTDYGAFFYVDASYESRTVANMKFNAALCQGSEIHFTMAIADVTEEGKIEPQIIAHVYKMNEDGTKGQLVISFIACTLNTNIIKFKEGISEDMKKKYMATWYQYYGYGSIPSTIDLDGSPQDYIVEIDNNSKNTQGADFCVDEIRFYTRTAKVLLTQTPSNSCNNEEDDDDGADGTTGTKKSKVKVYMEAEGLQSAFDVSEGWQPIYWRICSEDDGHAITGLGMYPQYGIGENGEIELISSDNDPGKLNTYGITYMKSDYTVAGYETGDIDGYGWYYDKETEKYYFQIAFKSFDALEEGKNYYVSVFEPRADSDHLGDDALWGGLKFGAKSQCSIYSEFFIPHRQYVTYVVPNTDNEEGGYITIECGGVGATVSGVQMILKVPDVTNKNTGYKDFNDFHFDYIFESLGTVKNPDATFTYDGQSYKYMHLLLALDDYRTCDKGKYAKETAVHSDYKNGYDDGVNYVDYAEVLKAAVNAQILELACRETFEHTFEQAGNYSVTCVPVEKNVKLKEEDEEILICAPFEVTFKLRSSGGPSLTLGFEGVDYEGHGNIRVVRVGLGQIKNMQSDGYLLHIPVNKFMTDVDDDETLNTGALTIVSEKLELLGYDADKVAGNVADAANDTWTNDPEVGDDNIYVATFDGQEINTSRKYISLDFQGVTSSETYKGFKEGFTYRMFFQVKDKDAGEGACEAGVEFLMKVVPEYVTWNDEATTGDGAVTPNTNVNTNWNNDKNWSRSRKAELYKTAEHNSDNYQDNGTESGDNEVASTPATFVPMKFTYVTIPTKNKAPKLVNLNIGANGIYTNINDVDGIGDTGNKATENIQYDLMVKVENECEHDAVSSVYDCEKFYGNYAKEIYFKPRAELVHQHYLTYEKAWVEKELVANKWYLMSTPLKETYAGDMYVPTDGQQKTEAFKAIKFTNTDATYSRTAYPIYQRSWGTAFASTVYTQTTDTHRSDYSANLDYTLWKGSVIEWGHTFNDVYVPYTIRSGFSIRAHKKDQAAKALIRLPKNDESYLYYDYKDDTEQNGQTSTFIKKTDDIGKFVTQAGNADITMQISDAQQMGGYVLVGNPYMASLDMKKFFSEEVNSGLEKGYYTYRYDEDEKEYKIDVYNETKDFGIIRPLESFFVNANKGTGTATATQIKFTADMMIDGNAYETAPSRMFALTASNDRGQSSATVSVGEEAKSVETLFDSNLSDVPMVYTVADGQAVSINQVVELSRPIAFGVTCTASNEPLAVTFSDIAQLTSGEVYVVDVVTGEQTLVTEGSTLSVQPNDYGRYFLLAGTMGISDKTGVQKGIVVSVRGKEVTVTSVEALTLVRAFSPSGATVYQNTTGGTSKSFILGSGVYIIQAENAGGEQKTAKVVLKTE